MPTKVCTIVAVICAALAGVLAVFGGRPVRTDFLHSNGPIGS
jgi:hypothetical protein